MLLCNYFKIGILRNKCNHIFNFRRPAWLHQMSRSDLLHNTNDDIFICSVHFDDEDIICGPTKNILKKSANPKHLMPVALTSDHSVQVEPEVVESYTQTDRVGQSHMVNQKGASLITELRRKRKIQDEFNSVSQRLKLFESGSNSGQKEIFYMACDHFMSSQLAQIVKALINEDEKKNLAYKLFCLNVYHASPQAYRLLSEDFKLPSISKLKEIVNLPMSTDINESIMAAFALKVKNMTETEKYCSVAVDIMRIKHNLFYSSKHDKVIGFHDIDGLQSPVPARYALVLVLKGLFVNWTQPIGYALLAETKCRETREEISRWIDKYIAKLLEIGLQVKTFICTAKTKLINEAIMRKITVDKPFFIHGSDTKIYYVYDFPHMFRMLRNYFMTHNFHFCKASKKLVAKFDDVKEFYEKDKVRELRIASELTDRHFNPSAAEKRDTKLAAELLSNTVAIGIDTFVNFDAMHSYAKDTADFLNIMSTVYETLTSSLLSPHTYRGTEDQVNLLKKVLRIFQTLKIVNSTTEQEDLSKVLFVKGIQVTIKTVLLLFEELEQKSFKHLLTARLSLSVTENLFKKIKTKRNLSIEPTSQRFVLKFRQLFSKHMMKAQSEGGISEDFCKAIAELNQSSEDAGMPNMCTPASLNTPIVLIGNQTSKECYDFDEKRLQHIAKVSAQVSSYHLVSILLRYCLEHHDCQILRTYVYSYESTHNLIKQEDDIEVKTEPISTEELFTYLAGMEDKFREVFENFRTYKNIVSSIYRTFIVDTSLKTFFPCPCFNVEFFQKMFIKVRVYMTLYYNNEIYRNKDGTEKTFIIPGL